MIFSTKNNQFAIFGKTIDDLRTKLINLSTVYEQYGLSGKNGVISSLFKSKKSQLIPEANLTKVLSFDEASKQLDDFNKRVVQGGMSLDTYFKQFQNGNTVLKNYVTTTDQQSQSTQGLIRASKEARDAQIAHNESIKAGTFSAKAGKVALNALVTVGNMFIGWAISKAIELVAQGISKLINYQDDLIEKSKEAIRAFEEAGDSLKSNKKTIDEISSDYEKLSQGVDSLGRNVSLNTEEYILFKFTIKEKIFYT